MYPYNNTIPPWMWPQGQTQSQPSPSPVQQITDWIRGLEELKKSMKEEKKDEKKKGPEVSGIGLVLFMLLIAPITGPSVFYFFQMSLHLLPTQVVK